MTTINAENILFGGEITSNMSRNYKSLGQFFLEKFQEFGDLIVMIDGQTGAKYSAKTLRSEVIHLIYCLKNLRIGPGDVIGICSENRFEFAVVLFAGICLNATVAPFNVTYTDREMGHVIDLSKPKIVFTSKAAAYNVAKVAECKPFISQVIAFFDVGQRHNSKMMSFRQLKKNNNSATPKNYESVASDKENDVALILCSSGTTGLPKGVQLTQSNIFSTLDKQFDPDAIQLSGITLLTVIPWFHSFGCVTLIVSSVMGTTLIYLPKFEEKLFLGAIEKYKVLLAFMVPPLMVFLAKHPIVDKYDLSSLQLLICGAAPLSKETTDTIQKRIGVPVIRQGYGLSESTLSLLVQTDELCKAGSVGGLNKGIYCKVVDTETGKNLGPMQRGELCFKGNCIMKGYIGDEMSTQTIIKDGWLHTGDVGYFDENFEFFIVDRIKELIKYKGFQVPPAEIEALLLTHPKVKDAAVVGKPDEIAGELPVAFVVKQDDANLTAKEVIKFVADHASPAKRLRGGVFFVKEIPKNPSGKILRRLLRDMIQEKIKSKL